MNTEQTTSFSLTDTQGLDTAVVATVQVGQFLSHSEAYAATLASASASGIGGGGHVELPRNSRILLDDRTAAIRRRLQKKLAARKAARDAKQ